ncbi:M48 family metallopeptidase [Gilvimarinus polysaccharolyticus]|uniref:M48 family metallopeptidase n=1 Tax=Gilvimarinus polysaccharolyticus TaxID=863921 RepID=UPI0012F8AE24|nr:M48 family metallopeptidase [Gilvimarinus polysaccharolyticus]
MTITTTSTYDCMGFNEALPKGKASGTLCIDYGGVQCLIREQSVRLPLQNLKVTLGGASNRLVFFEHPAVSGWSFYVSDRRVLRDAHLNNQPNVIAMLAQARKKQFFARAWITAIVLLIVLLPLLLVFRMDMVTGVIAKKIPVEWEQKLGESSIAQYQIDKNIMPDEEAEVLLQPLVQPLLDALQPTPYQYRFHIVNEGSLNAFALPGGQVMLHSALILRADSAEELLGVLAHEMIHVEQQHGLRNVMGAAGIYVMASAVLGDASGLLAMIGTAAPLLLNQSYSRRFETQSDTLGFKLLTKANINPAGLASFFKKLIDEEKSLLENIEDEDNRAMAKKALQFLSPHPASEKRIEQLNELQAGTNKTIHYLDLSAEFLALQVAVKQFITEDQGEKNNEE